MSNHIGTFDPFVLITACARAGLYPRFMATGGMFTAPVFGAIMRACGHIKVDRGRNTVTHALRDAAAALEAGSCVVIYPEGAITLDPGLWPQRAKTGAARLAFASGAPVVAVAQWGAHEIMAWDSPATMARTLLSSAFRRPIAKVHFGDIVDLSGFDPAHPHAPHQASDAIMRTCAHHLDPLREDEPVMPRHIDPLRPLSTARTLSRQDPPQIPSQRTS